MSSIYLNLFWNSFISVLSIIFGTLQWLTVKQGRMSAIRSLLLGGYWESNLWFWQLDSLPLLNVVLNWSIYYIFVFFKYCSLLYSKLVPLVLPIVIFHAISIESMLSTLWFCFYFSILFLNKVGRKHCVGSFYFYSWHPACISLMASYYLLRASDFLHLIVPFMYWSGTYDL